MTASNYIILIGRDAGSGPGKLSIDFCNIRGLKSNFLAVEHHLAHSSPDLLLLSETQLASSASCDPLTISNYNLLSRFRSKGGVCAYCNTNTPIARLVELESPIFYTLWLKISLSTITIFLCLVYYSPNVNNHIEFFNYLTTSYESLQTSHPTPKSSLLGTSMHTTRNGSTLRGLLLVGLKPFLFPYLTIWNKS